MTYYKLVASGRPDVRVDEIILKKDDSDEVELSVSVHQARDIPDYAVDNARTAAERIGYSIVEAEAPEEGAEAGSQLAELQEVGTDVIGMSPLLDPAQAEAESPVGVDQGSTDVAAEAGTSDSGSPHTAATPSTATPQRTR